MKKPFLLALLLLSCLWAYPANDSLSYAERLVYRHKPLELYNEIRIGSRLDRGGEVFAGSYLGIRFSCFHYGVYVEKVFIHQSEKAPFGSTSVTKGGIFGGGSLQVLQGLEANVNLLLFTQNYYNTNNSRLLPEIVYELQSGLLYRINKHTKISLFHAYSFNTSPAYRNLSLGVRTYVDKDEKFLVQPKNRFGLLLNRMGRPLDVSSRASYVNEYPQRMERLTLMNELAQPEFRFNNSLGLVWLDKKQNVFGLSYGKNQYTDRTNSSGYYTGETGFLSSVNHQFTLLAEINLLQRVKNYKYPFFPVVRIGSVYERISNSGVLHDVNFNEQKNYEVRESISDRASFYKNTLALGLAFHHAGMYLSGSLQFFEFRYLNHRLNQQYTYTLATPNSNSSYSVDRQEEIFTDKTSYAGSFRPALQLSAAVLLFQ